MNAGIIKDSRFHIVAEGIAPDSKKRLSLSKALADAQVTFNVYVNTLGQIVLDPHKKVPAHEAWVFENKDVLASLKRGMKQAVEGKTRSLGSFAKYAEKD